MSLFTELKAAIEDHRSTTLFAVLMTIVTGTLLVLCWNGNVSIFSQIGLIIVGYSIRGIIKSIVNPEPSR